MEDGIDVAGRLLKVARMTIDTFADRVTFRVDDDANSEFWFTLTLDVSKLVELLGRVAAQDDRHARKLLLLVEELKATWEL